MEHEPSVFKNSKNKAIPYAKVGRRVFGSLFNAETFCSDHGLDVNSAIEYGEIPELKNEVQEIAKYQKAVLREVLHRLEKRCSFLHGEITGFSNSLSVCHPLDRGYLEDRLKEAIAKSTATHEAREMVWTILEELERLSEWHD